MKLETPNIAGIIGLGAAIKFIQKLNVDELIRYEHHLLCLMSTGLDEIPNLDLYGKTNKVAPIFSFNIKNMHHHDLSTLLAENSVLIRSGHLCNQGLMSFLNIDGCARVSLSLYNSEKEVVEFIKILKNVIKFLKGSF